MNIPKIPQTDSIQELARFWVKHNLADFEDQLEEVPEPVFERKVVVKVHLGPKEIQRVDDIARSKGIDSEDLIREWILEKTRLS